MTSFAKDIVPLFRSNDVDCMRKGGVELTTYAYMSDPAGDANFPDHASAKHVLARLKGDEAPRMPPGGPYWSDATLNTFQSWMDGGYAA
jgi:hypothetical protein